MNLNHPTTQIRYQNVRLLQITPAFFEYSAIQKSNKREVILKIQNSINSNVLQEETAKLIQIQDIEGIPEVVDYGNNNDQRYFLATQTLGPTFSQIMQTNQQMPLKNVLLIGLQLITLIQKVHEKNFILSNIVPWNFCIGSDIEDKIIYLKDLTTLQSKNDNNKVIKFPIKEYTFLSPVFNIDKGPSQIDDLYSLAYLLIYLNNAILPWQQINQIINEKQFQELQSHKLKITFDQQFLDQQSSIFREWFKYLSTLKSSQHLNYNYLKNILISKIYENGWKLNDQIEYKNEIMSQSSKSIVSIKSRSRGTSITKTPNQRMIETLSPIMEVDKEFELAQSAQKQSEEFSIFQQFQNLKNLMEDQQQTENNLSFSSIEQNECQIWKKMEILDKISKPMQMMNKFVKK
ncbi:unnamed protein product [Paramecium primaurelia]|uniref:Protein kinase domain-containing protein n=1 Tax=Paramecium primaurelia TaxID=5886 RepID=A0A8S1PGL0_PARPR|nr:unnamed protein product [Paramecium primaurelia]